MKGFIHSIETFGTVDGPGTRYVIFMQGCFFRCKYCHNPDTWAIKSGKKVSVNNLVKDVKKYLNYIADGGVTFSGGEPLIQSDFVFSVAKKLKKLNIHVALDTAGSLPIKKTKKVIDVVDLVMLDIKALDSTKHKEITGCDNKNTLETLSYCNETNKSVWVRYVIVPGLTESETDAKLLAEFLKDKTCVKKVEIIPFHKMGEFKWKELGIDYKLENTQPPTKEQIRAIKQIFKNAGLSVK